MALIRLAPTMSGVFCVSDACATQKALPATEITSMYMETSSVCRVFNALNICGTRIKVHSDEAIQPKRTSVVNVIAFFHVVYREYL